MKGTTSPSRSIRPGPLEAGSVRGDKLAIKKTNTDENDFEAMDRLAQSITLDKLRPLSPEMKKQWEAAKRGSKGKHGSRSVGRLTELADCTPAQHFCCRME